MPSEHVHFADAVYGDQSKSTADIEDFALLRSDGMPTYHLASCADDADLRISHIIRGQDHLTNTFKHVLIFEAAGATPPQFAHLPLLVAPDGTKLSKRRHGPVVSVTTYRDAGFLPEAFANFIVLLGWSPKNDREQMTRQELIDAFSLEGINRSNAVVNFKEEDPFDPKAVWLNAEHIRTLPVEELSDRLLPVVQAAGFAVTAPQDDANHAADPRAHQAAERRARRWPTSSLPRNLRPYDTAELIPKKGDAAMALRALEKAREVLAGGGIHPRRAGSGAARRRRRVWASKPARCSSPSAWRCAAARQRRRCLAHWKYWAAMSASRASSRPSES